MAAENAIQRSAARRSDLERREGRAGQHHRRPRHGQALLEVDEAANAISAQVDPGSQHHLRCRCSTPDAGQHPARLCRRHWHGRRRSISAIASRPAPRTTHRPERSRPRNAGPDLTPEPIFEAAPEPIRQPEPVLVLEPEGRCSRADPRAGADSPRCRSRRARALDPRAGHLRRRAGARYPDRGVLEIRCAPPSMCRRGRRRSPNRSPPRRNQR